MPDIVFINETPHDISANQEFDRLMQRVGLDKSRYQVLSIVPDRLVNNWFGAMYQDKSCLVPSSALGDAWLELESSIVKINPNVVVPLGEFALRAVTSLKSITKWRGSMIPTNWGMKCVPTLAPGHVLKEYIMRPVVIKDLQKVKSEAYHSVMKFAERTYIIRPSIEQIADYFQEIVKTGKCAVDIETQWHKNISCIGFSHSKTSAICIPFVCESGQYWSDHNLREIRGYINDILKNPDIEKYGQNIHYDLCYLKRDSFEINNVAFDTRVAQHCIAPELPADLAFLTSIHTDMPYYKDEGKNWRKVKDWNRYYTYNCVAKGTKILMSNYTWKNIEDVKIGDKLLAPDENSGNQKRGEKCRRWRIATVTKTQNKKAKCLLLRTTNGELILTPEHKVLAGGNRGNQWIEAKNLRFSKHLKSSLSRAVGIWEEEENQYIKGWLGGFIDGEGSLISPNTNKQQGKTTPHISIAQLPNTCFDNTIKILNNYNFKFHITQPTKTRTTKQLNITGSYGETIRALGLFKPIRLIEKMENILERGEVVCLRKPEKLIEKREVGEYTVYDITTTTGTFIANGFIVHNCKDAIVTREIVDSMKSEISSFDLQDTFNFEMSLVPEFVDSALKGMNYDIELRDTLKKDKKAQLKLMGDVFNSELPDDFHCVKCKGVGEVGKCTIKACPKCNGSGRISTIKWCAKCDGTGEVRDRYNHRQFCLKCNGEGNYNTNKINPVDITKPCKRCKGTGQIGKSTIKQCPKCEGKKQFINLNSPAQIKTLIYDKMKLPKILKRNTGIASTDIETLIKLQVKHPNPVFKKLIDYSKLSKQIEFLETKIDSDNRIRTTLGCFGELGRLKSSKNPFGTGTNLQCIQRGEFRKLFLPDEGYRMFGGDATQAEARIVAYESMDLDYIKIFEDYDAGIGDKIHTINAKTIFEKDEISEDEYQLGKRICHGLNYKMGVQTLCDYVLTELGENYAITTKEARKFSEAYFAKFRGIPVWHLKVFEELKTTRTLTNCFGRKRPFLGRIDATMHRKGVAYKPQSGVADLTNRGILRVKEQVPECEFLHQDHDELIFQARLEHDPEDIKKRLVAAMTIPITINDITFVIPIDMKYGKSWGELK